MQKKRSCELVEQGPRQAVSASRKLSHGRVLRGRLTYTFGANDSPAFLCHGPLGLCVRSPCLWAFCGISTSSQAEALEAERATTVAFLEPLKTQLRDLEDQLKESSMKIDGVKAGISANDKKINSLLKMMITS